MITYGKRNKYLKILDSFRHNPYRDEVFERYGLEAYNPEINKLRFGTAIVVSLGLLAFPFTCDFVLIPAVLYWGVK